MNRLERIVLLTTIATLAACAPAFGSSHMDAPLVTLDPAANTTDVYAFRSTYHGLPYLTVALGVYPFEEPGIGPNAYNFDDNVLYQIHVALGSDVGAGQPSITYEFRFKTNYRNSKTVLQSYLGEVGSLGDANQNLRQSYTVTKVRGGIRTQLDAGMDLFVPPNNQGLVTRYYNQNNDGEMPSKGGSNDASELDRYTQAAVYQLANDYVAFAGQRDDGFYADIQSIFDLDFTFGGPNKPYDSQGGYNIHMIVLNIPLAELGNRNQVAGVYATTSRRQFQVRTAGGDVQFDGPWIQVGRQGNPLFCEAFVAIEDKDRYNSASPAGDRIVFAKYALQPELAAVLVPLLGLPSNRVGNRTDLAGIFIPDMIKVDLSTDAARLDGNPADPAFNRLSVFGGDVLTSQFQDGLPGLPPGTIPGGWPNGRRFGDDVVDIGVTAVISDLRTNPLQIAGPASDKVDGNDTTYNGVFPYAATPLNGRNHRHHQAQ